VEPKMGKLTSTGFFTFLNPVVSAVLALIFYILLYLPIEFLITEIWLITPKIMPLVSFSFLLSQ